MAFTKTVYLDNNIQNIAGNSTCKIIVDPSTYFDKNSRIFKIEYSWGDGTTNTVLYKPSNNYTKSNDVGDPRNFPQTHVFSIDPEKNFVKNQISGKYEYRCYYTIQITVYTNKNINNPDIYTIFLNLFPENFVADNSGPLLIKSAYSDIHLVKTKMIGPENHMLYVFEITNLASNQTGLFLSLVDWKKKIPSPVKLFDLNRDYSFELPFLSQLNNNLDATTVNYKKVNY